MSDPGLSYRSREEIVDTRRNHIIQENTEGMRYKALLVLGQDDIGKRTMIKCVCKSLGF